MIKAFLCSALIGPEKWPHPLKKITTVELNLISRIQLEKMAWKFNLGLDAIQSNE